MLRKIFLLLLLALSVAACKTTKRATEVSATSRTLLADSTHMVRETISVTDSSTVVAILTIDSLTLAPVAEGVLPDSLAKESWSCDVQSAIKQLATRDNSSRLQPLRVYGLRLAVNSTAVTQAAADSSATAGKSAVEQQTVTHSEETAKSSAPSFTLSIGFCVGFFVFLAGLALFLYKKHAKA